MRPPRSAVETSVSGPRARKPHCGSSTAEALVPALERRLLQAKLTPSQDKVLREYLDGQPRLDEGAILNAIRLVMSTPEYQVT